jgi:hypothetical protein
MHHLVWKSYSKYSYLISFHCSRLVQSQIYLCQVLLIIISNSYKTETRSTSFKISYEVKNLNVFRQFLFYADDVNLLCQNENRTTVTALTEILWPNKTVVETDGDDCQRIFLSCHQNS